MNINCIIVDDEQLARALIKNFVDKTPSLTLIGEFKNPLEAIDFMQLNEVDLIFLDIQMPDLTGMEMVQSLEKPPKVIFTTAYSEHAVTAFSLDAVDYLLKPFSFDRFLKAVNKVKSRIAQTTTPSLPVAKLRDQKGKKKDFITVKADHKLHKIAYTELKYIEGLKEYVSFYTKTNRIVALESLKNLENTLPKDQFIRVHKSYIVPIRSIKNLEGNRIDLDGIIIPVGKMYRDTVLKRVFEED